METKVERDRFTVPSETIGKCTTTGFGEELDKKKASSPRDEESLARGPDPSQIAATRDSDRCESNSYAG